MIRRKFARQEFRREGIFADFMGSQSRVRARVCAQRQVRRESVIYKGHTLGHRVISDSLGRTNTANTSAVDLNVADAAIVDEMLRHVEIVGALSSCELDATLARERSVGVQRTGVERLFQPNRSQLLERREARSRRFDVVAKNLSNVHHQQRVLAQPFTCSEKMFQVGFEVASADRTPSKFHRAKVLPARSGGQLEGLRGSFPKQLRCIRKLAE